MKILIIRNYPSYMAVKNNTYNIQEVGLAKALVRKGNICDIVFWTDKMEEDITIKVDDYGEIKVFYRHGKTMLKNTVYSGCDELFEQYDVLQPCEYNQIQAWLLAKKYPNKTLIYHGPYYSQFNTRYNLMCKAFDLLLLKRYIRQATNFLVKSAMAKEFLESKGIPVENIHTVGVGIDAQMLSNSKGKSENPFTDRMRQDSDKMKILYIGRFEERRNIPFIFEVFSKVFHQNNKARLYLIGTGNKEYMEEVFAYAQKLKIRDYIIWQERMEQKYLSDVYKLADFFLLPTKYEIFGMVLLEAMYYKSVVLTTRNGGSSTLICNGNSGFIIEDENADSWAKCILESYENTSLMEQIQNNASKVVAEKFTWDALAEEFLRCYRSRLEET